VVDHETAADLSAGVDLDTGAEAGKLGIESGQETKVVRPEPVADAVENDGVNAGI